MVLKHSLYSFIFLIFLISTPIDAQEKGIPGRFGMHAGINGGLLGGGIGPSLSFHYALRTEKLLQLESVFSYDHQSGDSFLSGNDTRSSAISFAAGARFNFLPNKNWNPSLLIVPGVAYGSRSTRYTEGIKDWNGISGVFHIGLSLTTFSKHMFSTGLVMREFAEGIYLKYGFNF